jgi:hypothetical protein
VPERPLEGAFTVLESAPLVRMVVVRAVGFGLAKVLLWVKCVTMEPEAVPTPVPTPVPVTRLVTVLRVESVNSVTVVMRVEVDVVALKGAVKRTVVKNRVSVVVVVELGAETLEGTPTEVTVVDAAVVVELLVTLDVGVLEEAPKGTPVTPIASVASDVEVPEGYTVISTVSVTVTID